MKFLWVMLIILPLQVWAHGGEDHGDEEQQVVASVATNSGSRASASSDLFELVLVVAAGTDTEQQLTIYLHNFADNSPVADAVIELEATGFSGIATMLQAGVYQLKLPKLAAKPYAVAITVEAADEVDLLNTQLDLTPVSNEVPHIHSWTEYSAQFLLALGLLVLGLVFWRLAKRKTPEAS